MQNNNAVNILVARGLTTNKEKLASNLAKAFEVNGRLMNFLADPTVPEYPMEKALAKAQEYFGDNLVSVNDIEIQLKSDFTWVAYIKVTKKVYYKTQTEADNNSYEYSRRQDEFYTIAAERKDYTTVYLND